MVVLLLYDGLDNFLGRNRRGDRPQPTSILSPDRLVKVHRDDLENTGGNAAEVGKRFDCIGGLTYQPCLRGSLISARSLSVCLPMRGQALVQNR